MSHVDTLSHVRTVLSKLGTSWVASAGILAMLDSDEVSMDESAIQGLAKILDEVLKEIGPESLS
ncbi:MAG TPA: hypothetical protein PK765_02775 [bacterium]|nr:hypothetical protein [bacterium]